MTPPRVFKIHHGTTFRHGKATSMSWQMLRLQPREEVHQQLLEFDVEVSGGKRGASQSLDYFGNTVHRFSTRAAAEALQITMTSRVLRTGVILPPAESSVPFGSIRAAANSAVDGGEFKLEQFRQETPFVPLLTDATAFVEGIGLDLPALAWIAEAGQAFSDAFSFDPEATEVSTPLGDVIEMKRGVCQDFSHLFISCLRQLGVPAAYVSGYLLTEPPPGKPRLRGVDAMHAWISVWIPQLGWVDFDPTNGCFVSENHVVVARGRDYQDVSPIRGVFRGGARHDLTLDLTVEVEGEEQGELGQELETTVQD